MKLIVGLGNPGNKFRDTRHNIGFMVVDRLASDLSTSAVVWDQSDRHKALLFRVGELLLVKPQTFMNNSGIPVKSLVDFYRLAPEDAWVIHDDIDLPLGKIRIREKGGSAGHHGVDAIMKVLGTDRFVRFRLGIGRGMESTGRTMDKHWHHRAVISFVLSRFRQGEAGKLKHLVKDGAHTVRVALLEGIDRAMQRFH